MSSDPLYPEEVEVVCPRCESAMAPEEAFCPECGRAMKPVAVRERGAAALAYLTLVPAAVLLLLPEFRKSRFVRFHAWQSVVVWSVFGAATLAALMLSNVAAAVLFLMAGILAVLAVFFLWVVLSLKAWQGEWFELPGFAAVAERLLAAGY